MTSKLGWVQFTRSLDASRASARRTGWGDDERTARRSHRGPRSASRRFRVLLLRPGRTLVVIALVAVTIASWVM
jgi:hypothetical protein